jgi:hypothetical protein
LGWRIIFLDKNGLCLINNRLPINTRHPQANHVRNSIKIVLSSGLGFDVDRQPWSHHRP